MNKLLLIPLGIVIAGVLIAGAIIYTSQGCKVEGEVSSEEAGEKVLAFINDNLLRGAEEASLLGVTEENGIYKVSFEVMGQEAEWGVSRDAKVVFPQAVDLTEAAEPAQEESTTIGNFSVSSEEVCLEDGKPIVYFFGSESCPHCQWEHPVVEEVMANFEGLVSFHNNMDTGEDMDVFQRFSTGGIPAMVIGCKYYRVGSGENQGQETEINNLTALACKITNGQPSDVCSQVQDLIDQI